MVHSGMYKMKGIKDIKEPIYNATMQVPDHPKLAATSGDTQVTV
jgi:hypothetical protein